MYGPFAPWILRAQELGRIDGIEAAFLYGSSAARMLGDAGPAPRDIDVMVLGEPDVDAVYEACVRVEAAVRRPVNATILTPVVVRYGIASDACHDTGEELSAAFGFRTCARVA